jgi:hypothetical protein
MTDIRLEISEMEFALVVTEHTGMMDAWNRMGEMLAVANVYGGPGKMAPEMQELFMDAVQEEFDNVKRLFDHLGDEEEQAKLLAHLKERLDESE